MTKLKYEGNVFYLKPGSSPDTWKLSDITVHTAHLRLPEGPYLDRRIERLTLQHVQGAELVRSLYIPAAYTDLTVRNDQFPNLETVQVGPDNSRYIAQNGMILSKDGKYLHYALAAGLRETLSIPDSVQHLGKAAFAYTRCETIVFPSAHVTIPADCFAHSQYAKTHSVVVVEGYLLSTIANPEHLYLPDTVHVLAEHSIKTSALRHLRCNAPLDLPDAFSAKAIQNSKLETLALGPQAAVHGSLAPFRHLHTITVENGNPALYTSDGVLFAKRGKILRLYPPERPDSQYSIPADTRQVAGSAFHEVTHLQHVSIPAGAVCKPGAFQGCSALESVTIEGEVDAIPSRLFQGCRALQRVQLPPGIHAVGKRAFFDTQVCALTLSGPVTDLGAQAFPESLPITLTVIDPKRRGLPGILDAVWPRKRTKQLGRLERSLTLSIVDTDRTRLDQIYIPESFNLHYIRDLENALEGPQLNFAACDAIYSHILEQTDRVQYAYFRYTELMRQGDSEAAERFYAYLRRFGFDLASRMASEKDEAGIVQLLELGLLTDSAIAKLLGICEQRQCLTALAYLMRATEQRSKSHNMPL